MKTVKESNGLAIIEIDNGFYVVEIDHRHGQVYSVLASDSPAQGGRWYGGMSEGGVKYVASPRTRGAAFSALRRIEKTARE